MKRKRRNCRKVWTCRPVALPPSKPIPYPKNITKAMKCWNEFWTDYAGWERRDGLWCCISAGQHIKWMLKMEPAFAKHGLAKRGCKWEWIE